QSARARRAAAPTARNWLKCRTLRHADSRSRRRMVVRIRRKTVGAGRSVPGGRLGMDTQPAHALELEHGEQKLGRIARAARGHLDRLEPELLDLVCLDLGGEHGTADTRHVS